MNIKIGIVVIGRNEGERLIKCLNSLKGFDIPIVYIDSQSSDNSVNNAKELNIETLILDKSSPINASRARNTGFKYLTEKYPQLKYIHFIDADCELNNSWLEKAIKVLDLHKEIAIVCGRLHEKYKDKNIYTRLFDIDWYIPPGEIERCGGIFTMRCSVFKELNGFDEGLIAGADPELCFRVRQKKYKILCLADDMGTHDSAMEHFSQWWTRSIKCGYAFAHAKEWSGDTQQLYRVYLWAGVIPVLIIVGLMPTHGYSLLLLLIYPLQMAKIYFTSTVQLSRYNRFLYSVFCTVAKIPQLFGIIRFFIGKIKKHQTIIEYKT